MTDWKQGIEDFRTTTLKTYENEPDRIREDFNSESRVRDDYKGRALLELLQNADDAQVQEKELSSKVGASEIVFSLTPTALYCANGGFGTTKQGLHSICRLSYSPKERKDLVIGEKGLGFKSVLSLSRTPEIHSAGLHCRFSRKDALDFILSSKKVREARPELSADNVPLLRIPIGIDDSNWYDDPILEDLSKEYATIIKLPFPDEKFRAVREKLEEISPTILLFLKHLKRITLVVEGTGPRVHEIERGVPSGPPECRQRQCRLTDDGGPTDWDVFSRAHNIPPEKLRGLSSGWESATQYEVAFAVQKANGAYLPLADSFDNSIRVYFPTSESFPLPILFHATFYTGSARKDVNIEHEYNSWLTEKAVAFFASHVAKCLATPMGHDPCAHLDLLRKTQQREKTAGKLFADGLYQELKDTKFIPSPDGRLRTPDEVCVLPFDTKQWKEWYGLLGAEGLRVLRLVHLDCRLKTRTGLLTDLQVVSVTFSQVVAALEGRAGGDPEWFAKVYQAVGDHTSGKYGDERRQIDQACLEAGLLLTSDDRVVSGSSTKVFMPPDEGMLTEVPEWLGVGFVHPAVVTQLGGNKDQVLNSFLERFGVKRFRAREVMREAVSPRVNGYWNGRDRAFAPLELLKFLQRLLGPDCRDGLSRPESEVYKMLAQVPVPAANPKGEFRWAKAGETYFSKGWTGNELLERLYGFDPNSRFLCDKAHFTEQGFDVDNLLPFLYYIGVENQPRILETNIRRRTSPYEEFWDTLRRNHNRAVEGSFSSGICQVEFDTLDRMEDIFACPQPAKVLLNYVATEPSLLHSSRTASIRYIPYRCSTWRGPKETDISYLSWAFRNHAWLYDAAGGSPHTPSQIYIPQHGLRRRLKDIVPFVAYEVDQHQASWQDLRTFLLRIGSKDNTDEFNLAQWYDVFSRIAERYKDKPVSENDAKQVRSVYRDFLRSDVQVTENDSATRNEFMRVGNLLAFCGGKYAFYSAKHVLYVDRLDLFDTLSRYVPCLNVEANRAPRAKELFGLPALSENLRMRPDVGPRDETVADALTRFFDAAKPFLLARISVERNLTRQPGRLRNLLIAPVTSIGVEYSITRDESETKVQVPKGTLDSLLYEEQGQRLIYLNARTIPAERKSHGDFRECDDLLSELSKRLADLLEINLADAFQLILSKDDDSRMRILANSNVSDEQVQECRALLEMEEERPEELKRKEPESRASPPQTGGRSPDATRGELQQRRSRVLWGEDETDLEFAEPVSVHGGGVPKPNQPPGRGGPGASGVHYQPDAKLRDRTANAGMEIVKAYEKSEGRNPDDEPSRQRSSANRSGPGCDIHSKDKDGRLLRRIEVKSSVLDKVESVILSKTEHDTARSEVTGEDFYLYQVIKLDRQKYPEGPDLLIYCDPYGESGCSAVPLTLKLDLSGMKHKKVRIVPPSVEIQQNV